jgi:hypothetical protein
MSDFWEDDAKPAPKAAAGGFWEDDAQKLHPEEDGAFEAGIRSAVNTGSYGFAPRIEGAMGAVKDYATDDTLQSMGPMKGLGEAYNLRRLMAEDRYKKAEEEYPAASFLGSLPGAYLAPGPSIAKGASLLGRMGRSAATGAAMGLGMAPDLTKPKEAALYAGGGAAIGGAAHGLLEKGVPLVVRGGGKIGRALGNVAFGVPGEAAEHYTKNQAAVKAAPGLEQTTRNFLEHADQMGDDISQASGKSFDTLRKTEILSDHIGLTHPLAEAATSVQRGGAYGPEQKRAISFLNELSQDVQADAAANKGMLPLDRGKNLVRVIDSKIADLSGKPGADARVIQAFRDARSGVDNFLKASSPEYAREMEKLAADTKAFKGMTDGFRTPGGALNKMKSVMRGKSPFEAEKLSGYDKRFGTTFGDDLKNSYTKDAFTRDTTNGSRKTLLGTVLGSAVGAPVVGAVLGSAGDKYGGAIYQKILDGTIKVGKFTGHLMEAMKRGQSSFVATHLIMMKIYPEYRDLIESQSKGDNP